MAIKTGIGIGEAQVYDTSGLINNFAKLLQKQQQDEARFQTEIADILTRVDTKGVRDQDKAEIAKMYAATKDLYTQAANTKNFKDKALLKAEISKAVRDINEYAANSVNFSKKFADLNNRIAQDYYAYDPKVLDKLRDVGSKSLIEMGSDSQLDPFQYLKMPDAKIRDTFFNDIYKNAESFAKSSRVNTGGGFYEPIKTASDDQLLSNIQIKLSSNPEYRKLALSTLRQQNPEAIALDAESLSKALLAQELALYKQTKGNVYRSAERQYRKEGDKEGDEKLTYRQQLITGLVNKDETARQDLLAVLPANSKVDYRTSKAIPGKSKGGFGIMRITIPEASSPTGTQITEDIPLQSGSVSQKLNFIINQYSGEKIAPSRIGIVGGKGKGEKFAPTGAAAKPKTESGKIIVILDGQEGEIDASKWEAFQKKYPKAKRK